MSGPLRQLAVAVALCLAGAWAFAAVSGRTGLRALEIDAAAANDAAAGAPAPGIGLRETARAPVPSLGEGADAAGDRPLPDAEAIAAYRAGDSEAARSVWLEVLERSDPPLAGRERARVLYDLGNAAARLERWGEAVGWYTAAVRLDPRDADAWANLELARVEAGMEPADRGDLASTARRLADSVTPGESGWLALLGLLPLALALGWEAFLGGAVARRVAIAAAVLALLLATPWVRHNCFALEDPVLVISDRPVVARSEPRHDAARQAELAPGTIVERVDALPGWFRVELQDAPPAWIPAEEAFPLVR